MKNLMGEELQLWVSGKTLGCATSCSLDISSDDIDISCKDTGKWGASKRGKMSWSISTDAFYIKGAGGEKETTYKDIVDMMLAGTPVQVAFGVVANYDSAATPDSEGHIVPTSGWTQDTADIYKGVGTISSISLSADNGSISSYSVTINGVGALTVGA